MDYREEKKMENLSRWVREAGWWVRRCCCGEEDEDEEEKGRRDEEEEEEEVEVKLEELSFRKSRSSTSLPAAEVKLIKLNVCFSDISWKSSVFIHFLQCI